MNIYITTTFLGDTDTPNSFLGQAGKLAAVNSSEDALEFIDLPPAGSAPISGTYSDLDTLKSTNDLAPGTLYLMTDFQTIYDQPDYSDKDTPKTTVVTKTASVDPILLLATSPNTFAKEIWRPSTPKHRLEYDFDFVVTEYMNAPTKGRITKCIDEFNNETQYDHSVVLFKRYESVSGSGDYNSFWDTGFGSIEVSTFGSNSFNNKIGTSGFEVGVGIFVLGNNTFGDYTNSNTFGNNTYSNTFGSDTSSNTFGSDTSSNTFGSDTSSNIFGNYTNSNTFGSDTSSNTFGSDTSSNTFGSDTSSNIFGNYTNSNTFGDGTSSNTFGNYTNYNTFGSDATESNTFGSYTSSNIFGSYIKFNTFGNNTHSIDFTTATHIYQQYSCEIFKRQDSTDRLRYTDNTDALVVVSPTT